MAQEPAAGNRLVCPPRDLYLAVLKVDGRGGPAETPATTLAIAEHGAAPVAAASGPAKSASSGLWNPVPNLAWGAAPAEVDKALRQPAFAMSSMSRPEGKVEGPITLSDARILWNAPADVVLSFCAGRLQSVRVTFKQPPALTEAVAHHEKRFGSAGGEASRAAGGSQPHPLAGEAARRHVGRNDDRVQGTLIVVYEAALP